MQTTLKHTLGLSKSSCSLMSALHNSTRDFMTIFPQASAESFRQFQSSGIDGCRFPVIHRLVHISEEKCKCHQQGLTDGLEIPVIAYCNVCVNFFLWGRSRGQERAKTVGGGWAQLIKQNSRKKVNFLFIHIS